MLISGMGFFTDAYECFLVRVRTTGHRIAAAMGKLGGFAGVFVFPFLLHWKGLRGVRGGHRQPLG
jgi:hypothetical protein